RDTVAARRGRARARQRRSGAGGVPDRLRFGEHGSGFVPVWRLRTKRPRVGAALPRLWRVGQPRRASFTQGRVKRAERDASRTAEQIGMHAREGAELV